ncbi:MAG: hypothetical protein IKL65_01150 [Bacilli bacterium]|nr:hypothetical protein [Bacilli bacterium]
MNITEKKKLLLIRIEQAREILNIELKNGLITELDILHLLKEGTDYGFKCKDKPQNYKKSVLRSIFNSPFVLCDQKYLSLNIKQVLPLMLYSRYQIEMNELNGMLENGFISNE